MATKTYFLFYGQEYRGFGPCVSSLDRARHLGGAAGRRERLYHGYPRSPCVDRKKRPISAVRDEGDILYFSYQVICLDQMISAE